MKLALTLVKDQCGAARVPLKTINVAGRHKRFVGHFKTGLEPYSDGAA